MACIPQALCKSSPKSPPGNRPRLPSPPTICVSLCVCVCVCVSVRVRSCAACHARAQVTCSYSPSSLHDFSKASLRLSSMNAPRLWPRSPPALCKFSQGLPKELAQLPQDMCLIPPRIPQRLSPKTAPRMRPRHPQHFARLPPTKSPRQSLKNAPRT